MGHMGDVRFFFAFRSSQKQLLTDSIAICGGILG